MGRDALAAVGSLMETAYHAQFVWIERGTIEAKKTYSQHGRNLHSIRVPDLRSLGTPGTGNGSPRETPGCHTPSP